MIIQMINIDENDLMYRYAIHDDTLIKPQFICLQNFKLVQQILPEIFIAFLN